LIHLELDAQVLHRSEDRAKVRNESIGLSEKWIVPTNSKRGIDREKRGLPGATESKLPLSCGVVEETYVGGPDPAVDARGEAVHANVKHLVAARHLIVDPRFDRVTMREVVPGQERSTLNRIEWLGELREQLRMPNRTVQVDQEAGHRALVQWCF
jgi:hypothetical protein